MDNKAEISQVRVVTPLLKHHSYNRETPVNLVQTEYGQGEWKEDSRRPSPTTERKVYSSAINRFELNRPSLNPQPQGELYTRRL